MRTDRLIPKTAFFCSLVLGHASVLLGLMLALGWAFAFVLIVPQRASHWATAPHVGLPVEPPLIGLGLGCLGLLVARYFHQPVARFSVAGLILNAVPLALAVLLLYLNAGH